MTKELREIRELLIEESDGKQDFANAIGQIDNIIKRKECTNGRVWKSAETDRQWKQTSDNLPYITVGQKKKDSIIYISRGLRNLVTNAKSVDLRYSEETDEIGLFFRADDKGERKISAVGTVAATFFVRGFNIPLGQYDVEVEDGVAIGKIDRAVPPDSE